MKYLSICIPNYNRIDKLERLIEEAVKQIIMDSLEPEVEICISDDCSVENPTTLIERMKKSYPQVSFRYARNEQNMGMDYNFLNSVLLAEGEYCWIIGNDDLPTEHGFSIVIEQLRAWQNKADLLVTPFDIYTEEDEVRGTIMPLQKEYKRCVSFDTSKEQEYKELLYSIRHNSGLFGFLSNTIFRRKKWIEYREKFQDKLATIFIQMYMNIQTLEDGAIYVYSPNKIIKNYADDETNESVTRICKILIGLNGVVEYFFKDAIRQRLNRVIVDAYISGVVWELPEMDKYKQMIEEIETKKNFFYKEYFIQPAYRQDFFAGKNVMVFGAGNYGKKALQEIKQYNATIVGVIDSALTKQGCMIEGYMIYSPEEMCKLYDQNHFTIVVANHFHLEEMINSLLEKNIEDIAIIC